MIDSLTLFLLCLFAFSAGFVDAIAGGGGLIQTPAAGRPRKRKIWVNRCNDMNMNYGFTNCYWRAIFKSKN
jgi:hypothetical protein